MIDFDRVIERRGSASLKWDGAAQRFGAEVLPLWVADMDFAVAPGILDALRQRLEHPIFGYPERDAAFHQAARDWWRRRYEWSPAAEAVLSVSGVVPTLFAAVRAFTEPGDGVVVLPPVYPPFLEAVRENQRRLELVPLRADTEGWYTIDWPALEAALARSKLLLFCSPHNPVGRVWQTAELQRLIELCRGLGVRLVSDEIHADLSYATHTPLAQLAPEAVVLSSAGKAFNIAGLGGGVVVCADPDLRVPLAAELQRSQCHHINDLGMLAAIAAWQTGEAWLDALRAYLRENLDFLAAQLHQRLPQLTYRIPEFGYLAWLGVAAYGSDTEITEGLRRAGLGLNPGPSFGPGGNGYLRMNVATPRTVLGEGVERLFQALDSASR